MKVRFIQSWLGWNRKWIISISDGRYGTFTWAPPDDMQGTIKTLAKQPKLQAMATTYGDSIATALGLLSLTRHLSRPRGWPAQLNISIRCRVHCRF